MGRVIARPIARDFAAAEGRPLKDFIAGERLLIAAPEACAVKYDMPEVAVAGAFLCPAGHALWARRSPLSRRQPANTAPRSSAPDRGTG